jgi:hypothetical protein
MASISRDVCDSYVRAKELFPPDHPFCGSPLAHGEFTSLLFSACSIVLLDAKYCN